MNINLIEEATENIYKFNLHVFTDMEKFFLDEEIDDKTNRYPYIPFGVLNFLDVLKFLTKNRKFKSFIDVGCGVGDKVLVAEFSELFDKCSGIEFSKFTLAIGKAIFFQQREHDYKNLIQGDATEFNFKNYDFIYLYCPARTADSMIKIYAQILDTMPDQGIMVEVYPQFFSFFRTKFSNKIKFNREINRDGWLVIKKEGKKFIEVRTGENYAY